MYMAELNKKDLEHLAALARIDFKEGEEEKLLKDLRNILDYFKELQALDTSEVSPMTGGTDLKNILREDMPDKNKEIGKGKDAFPEKDSDYLRVPPIF
jgi:aspartyl-tRNA(Asn)/glutamyl-tRNA(Gln) amidotransferase subunit C